MTSSRTKAREQRREILREIGFYSAELFIMPKQKIETLDLPLLQKIKLDLEEMLDSMNVRYRYLFIDKERRNDQAH